MYFVFFHCVYSLVAELVCCTVGAVGCWADVKKHSEQSDGLLIIKAKFTEVNLAHGYLTEAHKYLMKA